MITALILLFLGFLLFLGVMIIRFVPDDCRLMVQRGERTVIMKPGIDFLIPFSDRSLGIIQIAYRNAVLCEFVFEDESYRVIGSYSVINEELITPKTPENFTLIPEIIGSELSTMLKTSESTDWNAIAGKIMAAVNLKLQDLNIRLDSLDIRSMDDVDAGA